MRKSDITVDVLRAACAARGYAFFEDGDFNLNIIGIRAADMAANTFNDFMCLVFKVAGEEKHFVFECTTDAGTYYRENPMVVDGTMVFIPGQYRGAYKMGLHQGKFPALVQCKRLPVWRDNNRDAVVDVAFPAVEYGLQGANIHHAAYKGVSQLVGKWSAGCQVLADYYDHRILMAIAEKAAAIWGNSFTYTLFTEEEVFPVIERVA
ncbi:hypothetical protein [Aliamphritea hakodatensis]|uniref:hypothetical protein n=1 Tax=Aliamphritea hakodatensis TaxID=2895352 RepID=UPI0022FD4741|nr:hypothetical protein [Aliamphritea hakodatensis]